MNNIPLPKKHASCQTLLRDTALVYHGILRRKRTVDSLKDKLPIFNWGNCYVVIHGGCMYMYNNELARSPEEAVSLFGFTRCNACPREVPPKILWPFKMVNALAKKAQTFYFSASSESTMQDWIAVITRQMAIANASMFSRHENSLSADSLSHTSSFTEIPATDCYDNSLYNYIQGPQAFDEKANGLNESWSCFYWQGSAAEADSYMRSLTEVGTYLVRNSSTQSDSMTLMVKGSDVIYKFKLNFQDDQVWVDHEATKFISIHDLLQYYSGVNISNCSILLGRPFGQLP